MPVEYREMLKRVDRVRAEWAASQAKAQDNSNNSENDNCRSDSNSSGSSMISNIGTGSSVNKSGGGRYSLVLLDEIGTGTMVYTSVFYRILPLVYDILFHTHIFYTAPLLISVYIPFPKPYLTALPSYPPYQARTRRKELLWPSRY